MSTSIPHHRTQARIRRMVSLALSVASIVIASANIAIFVVRPSTFLSDGTFGLSPVPTFLVDALWWTPVTAIAAVLLVGTMPAAAALPVDPLPRRLPMIVAIIACALVVICLFLPATTVLASLFFGLVFGE